MTDPIGEVARAVLYEGYILWPYRRSALKNRQRWTFGGVYPERFSRTGGENDPWVLQTQCLVEGSDATRIEVELRFLHIVDRRVARPTAEGRNFVDALTVGGERHVPWEEAVEREIVAPRASLAELADGVHVPIAIAADETEEWLVDHAGARAGVIVRTWQTLEGALDLHAEPLGDGLVRLTARVANTTPWIGERRAEALAHTFVATHTILRATDGAFVSLMDPPPTLRAAAAGCRNIGTWPVLAGAEGDRHAMLSSPITLYDWPRVAPESPGDLFDATEIDQLLVLSVLSLTDDEQRAMRETDPRAREILDRCQRLSPEELMRLHGAVRELRPLRER